MGMHLSGHHDLTRSSFLKVSKDVPYPSGRGASSGASESNQSFQAWNNKHTCAYNYTSLFIYLASYNIHVRYDSKDTYSSSIVGFNTTVSLNHTLMLFMDLELRKHFYNNSSNYEYKLKKCILITGGS